MILGAFSFATMGVGLKVASGSFNTFELVLYRGVVGVLVMGWVGCCALTARPCALRCR